SVHASSRGTIVRAAQGRCCAMPRAVDYLEVRVARSTDSISQLNPRCPRASAWPTMCTKGRPTWIPEHFSDPAGCPRRSSAARGYPDSQLMPSLALERSDPALQVPPMAIAEVLCYIMKRGPITADKLHWAHAGYIMMAFIYAL